VGVDETLAGQEAELMALVLRVTCELEHPAAASLDSLEVVAALLVAVGHYAHLSRAWLDGRIPRLKLSVFLLDKHHLCVSVSVSVCVCASAL